MTDYLRVSGLDGGSLDANFLSAFAVDSIVDGGFAQVLTGRESGDLGPTFEPVTVEISEQSPGALGLLEDASDRAVLPGVVEVDFTTVVSGAQTTTGKLLLSGATVVEDQVAGGGAVVTLDYTAFALEAVSSGHVTSSLSYSLVQDGGTLAAPPTASLTPAQPDSTHTYLRVAGLSGPGSLGTSSGLFDLTGEAFAVTGGGGSSPLVVTLNEAAAGPGRLGLLADLENGQVIPTVEVEDVKASDGGTFAYETIVLSNAVVTQDTEEGNTAATLVFDYASAKVTYTKQNPNGSPGSSTTVALSGTSATVSEPASPGSVTGFLRVSGLDGGSLDANFLSAFAVDSIVDGGFAQVLTGRESGDLGPTFEPVTVEISEQSPGALGLLEDASDRAVLPGVVEVDFTTVVSGAQTTTGKLLLSGATVVEDQVAGGGAVVTLDYTAFALEAVSSGHVTSSLSYSLVQDGGTLAAPPTASLTPAQPDSTHTYLRVAGLSGPGSLGTSSGLFDLTGEAFAVTGGGGSSPLVVTLNEAAAGPGRLGLLADLENGQVIPTVEVEDVKASDGGTFAYETIVLSNAVVTQDTEEGNTAATLVFDYASAKVTYTKQNPNGSPGSSTTVALSGTSATVSEPASPGSVTGFLRVSGLDGGSLDANFLSAFAVDSIVDGGFAQVLTGRESGDLGPTFEPVTVEISEQSPGALGLLEDASDRAVLPGVVEVDFTTVVSGAQTTTGKLLLSGATVVEDQVAGGGAVVTLDYTAFALEAVSSGHVTSSLSYSLVQDGGTLAAPPTASLTPAQPDSTHTYLRVAGLSGPGSLGTSSGLFDLTGEAFAVTGGGGSSPLVVTLNEAAAGPGRLGLLADLENGQVIPTVEVEDVKASDGGTFAYETIVLSNAVVTQDTEEGNTAATLVFDYASAKVTYTKQNPNGSPGSSTTVALVPCFTPGTMIRTPGGERSVEQLAIGDRVLTVAGAERPVRWIGHRSYAGRFLAGNPGVWPVCITAGALGDGLPRRDLRVSPCHAMLLDGMLIPAIELVNGSSIVQPRRDPRRDLLGDVHYVHLELEDHDVIVAEGAASETFVDDDSRMMFQNAQSYFERYGQDGPRPATYCAPRVTSGEALEAVRRRLAAVALQGGVTAPHADASQTAERTLATAG